MHKQRQWIQHIHWAYTRIHLSGDSNEYLYLNVLLIFCSQIFGILALWHDRTSRLLECGKRRCHHALANVICSRHQVINLYDYEMKYWRLLISTLTRKLRIDKKKKSTSIHVHVLTYIYQPIFSFFAVPLYLEFSLIVLIEENQLL